MGKGNRVGADVLGDATRLAGRDVGFADDIQQRGLAVIHVAHDGDHRRTQYEILRFVIDIQFEFLDRGVDHAAAALAFLHFETEPVLGAQPLRDGFVDRLVHVGENVQFHQVGDQLERLLLELLGQIAHDDRRLHRDQFAGFGRDKFGCGWGRGFGCGPFGIPAVRARGRGWSGWPLAEALASAILSGPLG